MPDPCFRSHPCRTTPSPLPLPKGEREGAGVSLRKGEGAASRLALHSPGKSAPSKTGDKFSHYFRMRNICAPPLDKRHARSHLFPYLQNCIETHSRNRAFRQCVPFVLNLPLPSPFPPPLRGGGPLPSPQGEREGAGACPRKGEGSGAHKPWLLTFCLILLNKNKSQERLMEGSASCGTY